ncbi:MAG: hypothetical protein ACRDPY_18475 [Streptosporangiaceae bacterium]
MSIKGKVLAAAATLTLLSGVGAAGALSAGTASAATPSCGGSCIDIFSHQFGTHHTPNYAVDVLRQGEKVGQPIILFRTANFDPALDWTVSFQGTVADFYAADLVGAALALHYGCTAPTPFPDCDAGVNLPAFEIEYAPYGVDSGLCMGVASTAVEEEGVSLQPCGVSGKTVWITDTIDSPSTLFSGYVPLINGSDTNFSQPFVLTYPSSGYPTNMPRPQLQVDNLSGSSQGFPPGPVLGTVNDNQLWGADFGVLN